MQMRNAETLNFLKVEFGEELGKLPVVDAREPLRLQPMQCDVKKAKQKDPTSCVFARAAKRQFGATRVVFWKTSAYIDLLGKDGKRRIERFQVNRDMRGLIEKFDRGEPFNEGRAFILDAPHRGNTMKANRKRAKVARKNRKVAAANRAYASKHILKKRQEALRIAEAEVERVSALKRPSPRAIESAARELKRALKSYRTAKARFEKNDQEAKSAEGKYNYGRLPGTSLDLTVRNGKGRYNIVQAQAA